LMGARPSVRRRFNEAVLEAVYVKDRKIARAEFSEVFAPLFSRPSSNKALKVDPRGFEPLTSWLPASSVRLCYQWRYGTPLGRGRHRNDMRVILRPRRGPA